jgi:hypothetical protein
LFLVSANKELRGGIILGVSGSATMEMLSGEDFISTIGVPIITLA